MHSSYSPELTQWQDEATADPAPAAAELQIATTLQSTPMEQQDENPWGVWPYVWFVDLHSFCRHRFHSFHRTLSAWRIERYNRRQQKQFWTQHGFRPAEDEMGLELL